MRYTLNVDERVRLTEETMHKLWKLPRYVYFSGEFTEESARKFREELEATEDAARDAKQEIIPIIIDSYGGVCYSLLSMVDAIEACKIPVATIVESKAMSAGAVLFSCGTEGHRYMGPNATIMIHAAAGHAVDKVHEMKASVAELDRLNEKLFKLMAKNCGQSENYFLDIVRKEKHMADWYLDADEAKKHNLANHTKLPSLEIKVDMNFKFGL